MGVNKDTLVVIVDLPLFIQLKSINKMISSIEEFSIDEQGSVSAHLEKLKLMRQTILLSPAGEFNFKLQTS